MGRWWDGMGRTEVSTRRNGSDTMVPGTGAPPLALEGQRVMGSGGWHQLRQGCKDAEYLSWRGKIIQIECTQIRTSNVVQDSIKSKYDKIVVWLHTTTKSYVQCKRTKKEIAEKCRSKY